MLRKRFRISLKIRIFLFFFSILSVMALIFIISFCRFISNSAIERLNEEYSSMTDELNDTSQALLWKLTLTSQQLLENEGVQNLLAAYKNCTNAYQKQVYYSQLVDLLSSLTMSETDIALFYFYDLKTEEFIYSSLPVNRELSSTHPLYQNSMFQYFGPTYSQSRATGNLVFILKRESVLSDGSSIRFSVESGYYSLDKSFSELDEKSAYVIFTNGAGEVLYNSMPEKAYEGRNMEQILNGEDSNFHTFSRESSQGWVTHTVVPHSVYTDQYQEGLHEFAFFTALSAIAAALLAFLFWRSIYHPLQVFERQLGLVLTEEKISGENPSSLPEFDYLFRKIQLLQNQIQEMLEQAVQQEKENTRIQVEKLRAQINPHFLLNTLNTVHWMALMNQQKDIDDITQALSHLLSYNLDRDSYNTNLGQELNAAREYIRLQKVRYQFSYQESVVPQDSLLNYPCPKFILQPFLENSLSHGYRDQMQIFVTVHIGEDSVKITITDTGSGMDPEALGKIRKTIHMISSRSDGQNLSPHPGAGQTGRGIGLSYVFEILHLYYDGKAVLTADSRAGLGTQFSMRLPKLKGSGYHVENPAYRR